MLHEKESKFLRFAPYANFFKMKYYFPIGVAGARRACPTYKGLDGC